MEIGHIDLSQLKPYLQRQARLSKQAIYQGRGVVRHKGTADKGFRTVKGQPERKEEWENTIQGNIARVEKIRECKTAPACSLLSSRKWCVSHYVMLGCMGAVIDAGPREAHHRSDSEARCNPVSMRNGASDSTRMRCK